MDRVRIGAMAIVALVLAAGGAPAAEACKGKLSGAVSGEFACSVDASYREKKDATAFVIGVSSPPAGVGSMAPCSFHLKGKPVPGKYTLKELGQGAAIVDAGGKTYTASAAQNLGSLTLEILKVEPQGKRGFAITGKVRATLQEIGGPGQVQVEVSF